MVPTVVPLEGAVILLPDNVHPFGVEVADNIGVTEIPLVAVEDPFQ